MGKDQTVSVSNRKDLLPMRATTCNLGPNDNYKALHALSVFNPFRMALWSQMSVYIIITLFL